MLSLVTIISIYREGGILKRLRATPLRPWTILTAHVLVKLLLTAVTMVAMVLAGRRYFAIGPGSAAVSFTIALLISTLSILSVGFVIASIVPTARFAQPIGALIFYPMMELSGLFVSIGSLPPALRAVARCCRWPLGLAAPGDLDGRSVARARGRRGGAGRGVRGLRRGLGARVPLGIGREARARVAWTT